MTALSFIQQSGPFSIRYCNKSLSSNGKDMLGGTFKKSKSYTAIERTDKCPKRLTSFPLRASYSLSERVAPSKNGGGQANTDKSSVHSPSSFTTVLRELGVDFLG